MPAARLLALDWGTSSLRARLLGAAGQVLEARHRPWGILHLPEGGFAAALRGIAGDWLAATPSLPAIAAGMVGSRRAGARRRMSSARPMPQRWPGSAALRALPGVELHIVPGVRRGGGGPT